VSRIKLWLLLAAMICLAGPLAAQDVLINGHIDFARITYSATNNSWDFEIHNETTDGEYEPIAAGAGRQTFIHSSWRIPISMFVPLLHPGISPALPLVLPSGLRHRMVLRQATSSWVFPRKRKAARPVVVFPWGSS
jgi:hypothetical protein